MFKAILTVCLAYAVSNCQAQLTTGVMQCSKAVLGAPFSVVFSGQTAELTFKGDVYRLAFNRAWRSQDGETWADYKDDTLVVTTNIPSDRYVSVSKIGSMHSMASCDVQPTP
ncbi:MAG: hypothetical protein ACKO69_10820 [Limnohabitans sp.]